MTALSLQGRDGRSVDLDMCPPCRSIWFDALESVRLAGLGWTVLLLRLAALPPTSPSPAPQAAMSCVRCLVPLMPLRNLNRYGRFAAQQCPSCLGQLQSHSMLLANRGLFRPLMGRERAALAEEKRRLECLHCGAGLDGAAEHCGYCKSPALVIDMPRLASALQEEESAGRASATATPLMAWSCRGCGQSLDPTVQTDCRGCGHPVVVPSLLDLGPLLAAVEAKLRAVVPPMPDTSSARLSASASRVHVAAAAAQSPSLRSRLGKSVYWFVPIVLLWWAGYAAMRPSGTDAGVSPACFFGGCGTPFPVNWPGLAAVPKGRCPDISGSYQPTDDAALSTLLGVPARGETIEISSDAAGAVNLVLSSAAESGADAPRLVSKRHASVVCKDGWLQFESPTAFAPFRETGDAGDRHIASTINLRKNTAGDLVVRKDRSAARAVAVWCGDGCKILPPLVAQKTLHEWVLWTRDDPARQAASVQAAGDPDTPQGDAVRSLKKWLPPGTRVVSVKPMAGGDVLIHFETVQAVSMVELQETLLSSSALQGRIESVNRKPGAGSDVMISLNIPKPKSEASMLQQRRTAEAHAARNAALAQHTQMFLRLLPPGGHLDNLTWQGDGLLAEVSLSKDQTFDSFLLAVHTSAYFTDASARSAEDNAFGGITARLRFRVR